MVVCWDLVLVVVATRWMVVAGRRGGGCNGSFLGICPGMDIGLGLGLGLVWSGLKWQRMGWMICVCVCVSVCCGDIWHREEGGLLLLNFFFFSRACGAGRGLEYICIWGWVCEEEMRVQWTSLCSASMCFWYMPDVLRM